MNGDRERAAEARAFRAHALDRPQETPSDGPSGFTGVGTCIECGKSFIGDGRAAYCSDECRERAELEARAFRAR